MKPGSLQRCDGWLAALFLSVGLVFAQTCGAAEVMKQDSTVTGQPPVEAKPASPAASGSQGKPPPNVVFETPPVPEFMIKKPAKPLTIEEMQKQADEASERARRSRAAAGAPVPAATDGGGPTLSPPPTPGK